ncbi:MAG: exodeoxyribonuclease VII small subunit [Oscillospiraceae bacterium]|nr:exodeoxyribonuclease VII small subunit [Oscillospiraceae bacterium]
MKREIETSMNRLHEISVLMNDETLSLEAALDLYAEAQELATHCKADMEAAQIALKEIFTGAADNGQ